NFSYTPTTSGSESFSYTIISLQEPACDQPASASVSGVIPKPAVNVTSQVRLLWPASYVNLGSHKFRGVFNVRNNSTQTLKNVELSWPKLPAGVSIFSSTKIASLAPGASATISVVFLDLSAYPLGNLKFYFPAQVLAG